MTRRNIRIRLKGFDHKTVDKATITIIQAVKRTGATISGPIPLPKRTSRITVLRSPHVFKKSREQFDIQTYKRLIDIIEPNDRTVDVLAKLLLAPGVDVQIKILGE